MPYSLDYKPSVRGFLRNCSHLSRQGRIRLFSMLDSGLRQHGDSIIADPARCVNEEKRIFLFDFAFIDGDGDGKIHHFRFFFDASSAPFGVLRIVYADESSG